LAFGDDTSHQAAHVQAHVQLPDLNEEAMEIDTTQNAPQTEG
jgi:hypothetical protein